MPTKPINPPDKSYDPLALEKEIREFWKENDIFKKSIRSKDEKKPFIFLEGPPTANGLPHPGHALTRTIKDVILRYKAMKGHHIQRKAGWDTHGLPVEIEVEKKLGLSTKQDIEKYGI
jgi:isoleucyl-tRNA synthetase